MATAQEQEDLNEVMQLLEATPDTAEPTGIMTNARRRWVVQRIKLSHDLVRNERFALVHQAKQ